MTPIWRSTAPSSAAETAFRLLRRSRSVALTPDAGYLKIMESLAFALDARSAVEGRTLRVTALS